MRLGWCTSWSCIAATTCLQHAAENTPLRRSAGVSIKARREKLWHCQHGWRLEARVWAWRARAQYPTAVRPTAVDGPTESLASRARANNAYRAQPPPPQAAAA
jgi:hypothetical protein